MVIRRHVQGHKGQQKCKSPEEMKENLGYIPPEQPTTTEANADIREHREAPYTWQQVGTPVYSKGRAITGLRLEEQTGRPEATVK